MKSDALPAEPRSKRFRFGIRTNLFIGFALLTVVIVALLWLFQIVFLNSFYKAIKIADLRQNAHQIVRSLDDTEMMYEAVAAAAQDSQANVLVADGDGVRLAVARTSLNDVFSQLWPNDLRTLYQDTLAQGGTYFQRYIHGSPVDGGAADIIRGADSLESVLYVYALETAGGNERLVILFASIAPLESTVETLRIQLTVITIIMCLLAFGLAWVISRSISKPIVRMNRSAAELAKGNYSVRFAESGARETAELAHSLNVAAVELSKVETLRRDLIANVSHDLRTPLTMITGYAEVMRDLPGENTPENVQIIIDEATRLTTLVNDLLDLSKLQSGTVTLAPTSFSLTECIRTILHRYDKLIDYQFDFQYDRDVEVIADELKITQVVYNLINNAVTYTGEDKKITLRQLIVEDRVRIEVSDTGEGIPEDKLQDIWERYYKVDKEHKRAQVGTGLGLSIVKTVIDLHGGTYGVQSALGQGSTFWFELPLPKEDSES